MSRAKARVAGAWVDTDLVGAARVAGAWAPYGPPSGPTYESLTWPNPPTSTALQDGVSTFYTMGIRFHLLAGKPCYGIRWRVPNTVTDPTAGHSAGLFNVTTQALLTYKDFTPVPGDYQDILFDTPYTLVAAPQEYVAAVWTRYYVHSAPTPASGWLVQSPSLNIRGDMGKLGGPPRMTFPTGNFQAWYYVSPLVGL